MVHLRRDTTRGESVHLLSRVFFLSVGAGTARALVRPPPPHPDSDLAALDGIACCRQRRIEHHAGGDRGGSRMAARAARTLFPGRAKSLLRTTCTTLFCDLLGAGSGRAVLSPAR